MSGTKGYVRWVPDEWLAAACGTLTLMISEKLSEKDALLKAQHLSLPKGRQRHPDSLWALGPSSVQLQKYMEKARAMTPAQREAHIATVLAKKVDARKLHDASTMPRPKAAPKTKSAPEPKLTPVAAAVKRKDKPSDEDAPMLSRLRRNGDVGRDYKGGFRWTTREAALLARMVQWFKDQGATVSLGRMFVEAQELVLPEDRRRSVSGIMQGNGTGVNERYLKTGIENLWLIKDVPFNPPRTPQQEAQVQAGEPAEAPPPAAAAAPAAHEFIDDPKVDAIEPEPPRVGNARIEAAASAFGKTMMGALDTLLQVHTDVLMNAVYAKMSSQATTIAAMVAAQVENGMRRAVHTMVEQEIGHVQAPPPAAGGAVSVTAETAASIARKLKVDVVGFTDGAHNATIASMFNGNVDLRFVHPDSASTYVPHKGRHCIMVLERIPHSMRSKARAAGVEPMMVRRTTGHVIHAIEELMRAEGIETAVAH